MKALPAKLTPPTRVTLCENSENRNHLPARHLRRLPGLSHPKDASGLSLFDL